MKNIRKLVSLLPALLLFLHTGAQVAQPLKASGYGRSVHQSQPKTQYLNVTGERFTGLLFDNGPIMNSPGTGFGGADESICYAPLDVLAWPSSTPAWTADDFVITDNSWDIDSISFYDIMPGCPINQSLYSACYIIIWDGKPGENGSHIIWGDRNTNRLVSTVFTNCYRTDTETPGGSNFPIFKNTCATDGLILNAGHYWIQMQIQSNDVAYTYAPPVVTDHPATGNAIWMNELANEWAAWEANTYPQGLPFKVFGSTVNKNTDAGIAALIAPASGQNLTASQQVIIKLRNYGIQTIQNVPVSYSVNGGTAVTGIVAGPIASEEEVTFTFPGTIDLSSTGIYDFVVSANLGGDQFAGNNQLTDEVYHYETIINMGNGSVTADCGVFYDSGGPSSTYGITENSTYTFLPASSAVNARLQFDFSEFETEFLYDSLYIFDGPDAQNSPLLTVLNGGDATSIGIIRSSHPSGALTFRFVSDELLNLNGWKAEFHTHIPYNHDLAATTLTTPEFVTANTPAEFKVIVKNEGNSAETNYTVKLYIDNDIEIGTVTGTNLGYNQEYEFRIPGTITSPGLHQVYAKVILTGDQQTENDACESVEVSVKPQGSGYIIVGKGNEMNFRLPVSYVSYNSLSESIYYPEEIGMEGMINGTGFIYSFRQNVAGAPLKIWMGETDRTDLSGSWIPSSELTLVFDGTVSYNQGIDTVFIDFTSAYEYHGGNLVMMVYRPLDYSIYPGTVIGQNLFQTTITPEHPNRTRHTFADIMIINPAMPRFGNVLSQIPNTLFKFDVSMMAQLKGTVNDGDGNPLGNALVTSTGSHLSSLTNNAGEYMLNYVWPGNHDNKAEKYTYNDEIASINLAQGSVNTHNFTLTNRPMAFVTGSVRPSDDPANGLDGATITLTGYDTSYTATTINTGMFLVLNIYGNTTYHLHITHPEYEDYHNDITVGNGGTLDLGSIILRELTAHPDNIVATDNNSTANVTWDVASLDYTIQYDNDSVYYYLTSFADQRESAIRFTPEAYPCQLKKAILNVRDYAVITGNPPSSFRVKVYDDDGTNNLPGTQLAEVTVTPAADGWCEVDLTSFNISVTSGDFYIVHAQNGSYPNYVEIGIDQSTHPENRSYSKPASWSSWALDPYYCHFMIRAVVSGSSSSDELTILDSQSGISTGSRETDGLTGYSVYRLHAGEEADTTNWITLSDNQAGNSYDDNDWSNLPWGEYVYAVRTNYVNGILSTPGFSNTLLKNVLTTANIELITNTDYIPADAHVLLTNTDGNPDHIYETNTNGAGSIQFTDFYKGTYRIVVRHHNFYTVDTTFDITSSAEHQIYLTERNLLPFMATATNQDTLAMVKWYNPSNLRDLVLDDSIPEASWAGTAGYQKWYGNYYTNTYTGAIVSCDIYIERHPFGSAEDATIDIFDVNHNLIGTSEPFVPQYDQWNTIRIPDVAVTGDFYAMVHFNQIMDDSHYLGLDLNGPNVTNTQGYIYDGNTWLTVHEFLTGLEGGVFMIRPAINISTGTNRSVQTYGVYRLEPGQENNPGSWVLINPEVQSTLYPDSSWYLVEQGNYRYSVNCNYSTGISSDYAFTNILAKQPGYPSPLHLSIEQLTESEALFTWTSTNREDLVEYKVYLNDMTTQLASVTDTSFTFTGLSINVPYVAGVRSVYSNGESTIKTIEFILLTTNTNQNTMNKPEIFPNPGRDVVFIAEAKGANVEIYSITGELMLRTQLEDPVSRLNLEKFRSGVYLVKIFRDNTVHTQKLIISE